MSVNWNQYRSVVLRALCAVCAYSAPALAAPSVTSLATPSGLTHGAISTITGTGFGTKSPAKPYLWADFNSGSLLPSSLGLHTTWEQNENMVYNASEGAGGTGVAKSTGKSGTWTLRADASGFSWNDLSSKMYLFRKTKRNFSLQSPVINWKAWRVWADDVNVYVGTGNGGCAPEYISGYGVTETWPYLYNGAGINGVTLDDVQGPVNAWNTDEIIYQTNSNLTDFDGRFWYNVNGREVGKFPVNVGWTTYHWKLRDSLATSQNMIRNFPVHGVQANAADLFNANNYAYWADDVYLDTTWARVMIGNAPTWGASTQKEIQIPTAWSDTSISIVLNRGTFSNLGTGYLYVVDANGNVNSNGYPLCSSCPKTGTNLR